MMIRIALCDDDEAFVEQMSVKIKEFFLGNNVAAEVICFTNGEILLNSMSVEANYDLVFLDMEMPVLSGMEIAKEVKKINQQTLIIFLTSFIGFAPDAFEVEAFRFITKFRIPEKLPAALADALKRLEESQDKMLTVSRYNDVWRIPYKDILYVQRIDRILEIVVTQREPISCRKGIKQLFAQLADRRFVFVDRGCFVNLDFLQEMSGAVLFLSDGISFTVSRLHLQNVKAEINRIWGMDK